MSLVARHLEAHGIPTLCLGSALDILEAGSPPRAAFVDYPLGHSAGKPGNSADQLDVVRQALCGFEMLTAPGGLLRLPNVWETSEWTLEASSSDGGDTRQPRDDTPQFERPDDRLAALASGALIETL